MLNQACARQFADECLMMSSFLKLNESHLKELGFRMGDRVVLMEWINKMNTDCAQLQPSMQSRSSTVQADEVHDQMSSAVQNVSMTVNLLLLLCKVLIVLAYHFM
jgi:hypothetical protein